MKCPKCFNPYCFGDCDEDVAEAMTSPERKCGNPNCNGDDCECMFEHHPFHAQVNEGPYRTFFDHEVSQGFFPVYMGHVSGPGMAGRDIVEKPLRAEDLNAAFALGVASCQEKIKALEDGLVEVARFIVDGNPAITDTIWYSDAMTLVDFIGHVVGRDVSETFGKGGAK